MEIRYYKKKDVIETYDDWERVFSAVKPKDWKVGRSAQSLAAFMMEKDGFRYVRSLVGKAINKPIDEIEVEKVTVEGRVAFDNYNHSREHDLAVVARTKSNQTIFIGVEAKVDESFGSKTIKQYETAALKKNENSKVPARIKGLKEYYPEASTTEFEKLQYQLATATAGCLCARTEKNLVFDYYVFMVLVFKTSLYNVDKGEKNRNAFDSFIDAIKAEEFGESIYKCTVKEKPFMIIYKEIIM